MQVKFAPLLRNTTEREFWTWFLKDELARVGKRDLLAAFARVRDLHEHYAFSAETAPDVPTLILESAQEEMLRPEDRARMKACYPRAEVYTFENAGHAVAITHREAYVAAIRAFIEGNRERSASA
jgi:pimeloyl-ACP methyl ester carboxylesterase